MITKKAPMFWNDMGSIKACRFFKDSFEVDRNFIYFKIASKLGTNLKNPERNVKEAVLKDYTYVIPLGAEHHKFDRSAIQGICNLRRECLRDVMMNVLEPLKNERDKALLQRDTYKKKAETLEAKVEKLNEELAKAGKIE